MEAVIVKSRCSEHPFVHFLAKLLFASCRAPLIKDIMQKGNCIIGVFLKWSLIAPNSFTLILPQHWKLTLYWFLFLQHSDSTVSRIVSTSTPSTFLLPRKHLRAFRQHWPTQMVAGACGKGKTGYSEGLLDGFQRAQLLLFRRAHRRFSSIITDIPHHTVCMSCHTADIYVST